MNNKILFLMVKCKNLNADALWYLFLVICIQLKVNMKLLMIVNEFEVVQSAMHKQMSRGRYRSQKETPIKQSTNIAVVPKEKFVLRWPHAGILQILSKILQCINGRLFKPFYTAAKIARHRNRAFQIMVGCKTSKSINLYKNVICDLQLPLINYL